MKLVHVLFFGSILFSFNAAAETINLELGETISMCGRTVSCGGGGGGGCADQPGTRECTTPSMKSTCARAVDLPGYNCWGDSNMWMKANEVTTVCRTFDGCGNLTGSFQDTTLNGYGNICYRSEADCLDD